MISFIKIIFLISLIYNQIAFVYNYYCNHNLCSPQEFCCGDNICCIYSNYYWTYFWLVLLIIINIASFAWILFHYFLIQKFSNQCNSSQIIKKIIKIIKSNYLPSKKVCWFVFTLLLLLFLFIFLFLFFW